MPSLQVPPTKMGPRKLSKDVVDTVENLDIKQLIVPIGKATKIWVRKQKHSIREDSMVKGTPNAKDILICTKLYVLIVENMAFSL